LRSRSLLVLSLVTALAAPSVVAARPFLAVSAEAGGEIAFVDPAKARVLERIEIGGRPRGLKLSRDKRRLFVALGGPSNPRAAGSGAGVKAASGLAILDVAALKVTGYLATAPAPFDLELSPDERTAYLSNIETNELFVVDVATGSLKKKVPAGMEPRGVAVRSDGKVVYVAARSSNEVYAIDANTLSLLVRIDAGMKPQAVFLPPKGELAFVPDEEIPIVAVLDVKQHIAKEQFVLQGLAKTPAPVLQSAVFAPDGKRLFVTTGPGKSVVIVELAKKAVVGTIDGVGAFPRGIAISRDGKKLYTANGPSNDVAIIDIASKKVEARVAVPGAPWDVVLLP
jgi:YVTN family beta-propeller protein